MTATGNAVVPKQRDDDLVGNGIWFFNFSEFTGIFPQLFPDIYKTNCFFVPEK